VPVTFALPDADGSLAGEALELSEALEHREWRQARAKAAGEIEWLRSTLPA
jgi:hypothetical protein